MSRYFLKGAIIALTITLLYHLGAFAPFAEKFNIKKALGEAPDISGEKGEALPPEKILVEVFLGKKYKKDNKALQAEWEQYGLKLSRVRLQFFKLGDPPENMAIGSDIPAPIARFAIEWALEKNKGVRYILPQFRFFKHHIVIGSSHYDEDSQIPITADDLESLRNPELTTVQFHEVYRKLTGEDKGNPTYLDSERFKE